MVVFPFLGFPRTNHGVMWYGCIVLILCFILTFYCLPVSISAILVLNVYILELKVIKWFY